MNNEICVPEGALATDAEAGGNVAPGVGDEVDFTGRGKVTRAENGQVYFTPTEINGQALAGSDSEPDGDEGAALDAEVGGMMSGPAGGGYGAGMLVLFLLCLLGFSTAQAQQNTQLARARSCSGGAVSNDVTVATPTQAFSAEINNYSGTTLYCLVFDSATNQLNGATPHFSAVAVPTGSTGGKDWNSAGAPFRYGVNVCLSTTPFSLTNATFGGTATVIHSPKN